MSKHYTNYSKPNQQAVKEPVVETPVEEVVDPVEENIVEAIEEENVETTTNATVVDCKKLNVRKAPNKLAGIVTTIPAGSSVIVDLDKSTVGFYKITTESGIEGFCVKEFIAIK